MNIINDVIEELTAVKYLSDDFEVSERIYMIRKIISISARRYDKVMLAFEEEDKVIDEEIFSAGCTELDYCLAELYHKAWLCLERQQDLKSLKNIIERSIRKIEKKYNR